MRVQVMYAADPGANALFCLEATVEIPAFASCFAADVVGAPANVPQSNMTCAVSATRLPDLNSWLSRKFSCLSHQNGPNFFGEFFSIHFCTIFFCSKGHFLPGSQARTGASTTGFQVQVTHAYGKSTALIQHTSNNQLRISTEDIDLMADLAASVFVHLGILVWFPSTDLGWRTS